MALFSKDVIFGFEEGLITGRQIKVEDGGLYTGGDNEGDHIMFFARTFSFAKDARRIMDTPKVKEQIIYL